VRRCAIAEGYSEFVARSLADDWSRVADLKKLSSRDAGFHAFVLKHIDATASSSDLAKAEANAREKCPSDVRALCSE
jgi:hypothetical protein